MVSWSVHATDLYMDTLPLSLFSCSEDAKKLVSTGRKAQKGEIDS